MKRLLAAILLSLPGWISLAEAPLRVGTYNLCTGDSRKNFIEHGKQGYVAGPQRYWCNSAVAAADMIVALDCDVLGLQEVCDSIWGVKGDNDIKRLVAERKDVYDWILYPNSGKGTISYDTAIAYKREAVEVLESGIFWLGGILDQPKTREGEPKWSSKPCTWARMRRKDSGREFYFMSTHTRVPQVYPNNEFPKNRANILNLQELRKGAERLVPADVPSILVGDLNIAHNAPDWHWIADSRWKDVFETLRETGDFDSDALAWGTQNMKDESGYSRWYPDHVMLHGFEPLSYEIDRRRFPTADGTLHYPSDHLPVVSDVVFAAKPAKAEKQPLPGEEIASVCSADGQIRITLYSGKETVWYAVRSGIQELIAPSPVSMTLADGTVFGSGKIKKVTTDPGRITLTWKTCSLEFRAENDGVAWRWSAGRRKPYQVAAEQASFRFASGGKAIVSFTHKNVDPYQDDFQNLYTWTRLPVQTPGKPLLDVPPGPYDKPVLPTEGGEQPLVVLPALVSSAQVRMVIAESDVIAYPGMFLKPAGQGFDACFAGYPAAEEQGGKRNLQWIVTAREPYIASCDGKARSFPWRVVCIARDDKDLAMNDLVTRLATPPSGDFSWVRPGKVAWEWWSAFALDGVDFTPGVNTVTYKAYIDFAARHGIEYILLDEGWAVRYADDLMSVVPEIDLQEIIRYGRQQGVGIILWAGYSAFAKDMEKVCRHYAELGAAGFKIDFLERSDQPVQEFMYKAAETAARHHLVLDFHGCPPPTGLQKTFPNVLNYEGIFGLEQMRNRPLPDYDMVRFDVTAPFIRFVTGPADYTPGAFLNGTRESFVPCKTAPMSQGTRCRQLAAYVVFEGPLQMLCDSPSRYEADPACAEFIYRVPTVWDETRVLAGEIGKYIVTARRRGDTWYIGALTDWTERDLTLDLSPLSSRPGDAASLSSRQGDAASLSSRPSEARAGIYYRIEAWEDGPDAAVNAQDWQKRTVQASGKIKIHLAPGGGWAGIVKFAI